MVIFNVLRERQPRFLVQLFHQRAHVLYKTVVSEMHFALQTRPKLQTSASLLLMQLENKDTSARRAAPFSLRMQRPYYGRALLIELHSPRKMVTCRQMKRSRWRRKKDSCHFDQTWSSYCRSLSRCGSIRFIH